MLVGLVVVFLSGIAIQLIPYGRTHNNPPVIAEPKWDSPKTRELFFRACGDCHSNETVWPWYSNIAPVSWLIQRDVDEGRAVFNVSEWGRGENEGDDAVETVQEGSMPPLMYTIMHPSARLSIMERQMLIQGLAATFGSEDEEGDESEQEDEHDEENDD
ncbi:MAG: heme-binding domain-containing protein [Anaerolineae bacterium]|uniref:heme-binding domain-containing protein n=1 Tax=Thermoflexus sp. TaxID=1969742 RepID=UPI0025E2FDB8|nr:heme-binding domain-containing protein [Thermoflexus sp.]MCS7351320.1 heme-binding domain-containing protein [Thermoflexus sp.]MDW8180775.1 heme-binding domain-containing protein [Anaerolineae bacterium]